LFDGGLVVDYLKTVKAFLDANPYEVFTFVFTNPELLSIPDVWKPQFDAAGGFLYSKALRFKYSSHL
jgi:hypothetical protein